jgi:hypothetical protein
VDLSSSSGGRLQSLPLRLFQECHVEVAVILLPALVLLDGEGPNEPQATGLVGKDPRNPCAAPDLLVEANAYGIAEPFWTFCTVGRPHEESRRRQVLRVEVVAVGLAEKAYERGIEFAGRAPGTQDPTWIARLERQIGSTLAWLELQRPAPFLVGPSFSVGDVTAAVALNVHQREVAPAFALWPGACLYRSGRRLPSQ